VREPDDWSDCRVATARYLEDCASVAALLLGRDHRVVRTNRVFLGLAGGGSSPVGRPVLDLLEPSSRPAAERLLAGASGIERLQLQGADQATCQVDCRAYREGEGWLLLAETPTMNDSQVLRTMSRMTSEVVNLGRELERKNRELERALEEVKKLQGILTICMHCKKIKGDEGLWQKLEVYVREHTDAEFSHGLCEACATRYYPDEVAPKPRPRT
jgi:hypothetical protein